LEVLLIDGAAEDGGMVDGFAVTLAVVAVVGSFVETDDGFIVDVSLAVAAVVGFEVSLNNGFLEVVLCEVSAEVGLKVDDGFDVSIADGFDVTVGPVVFEVGFPVVDNVDGLEVTAAVAMKEGDAELDAASAISTAIPDAFLVTFDVDAEVGLKVFELEAGLMLDLCSFVSLGFSVLLATVGFDDLGSLFFVGARVGMVAFVTTRRIAAAMKRIRIMISAKFDAKL
jgi:hypothetical protein